MEQHTIILVMVGEFNPVTNMHLRAFVVARDWILSAGLCRSVGGILLVDNKATEDPGFEHRMTMVNLALEDTDWITADSLGNRSLSDFLNNVNQGIIAGGAGGAMLLCGSDYFSYLSSSKADPNQLISILQMGIVVVNRQENAASNIIYTNNILATHQSNIIVVEDFIRNHVSSAKVREAVRGGESIRYVVADRVAQYIHDGRLYIMPTSFRGRLYNTDFSPSPSGLFF